MTVGRTRVRPSSCVTSSASSRDAVAHRGRHRLPDDVRADGPGRHRRTTDRPARNSHRASPRSARSTLLSCGPGLSDAHQAADQRALDAVHSARVADNDCPRCCANSSTRLCIAGGRSAVVRKTASWLHQWRCRMTALLHMGSRRHSGTRRCSAAPRRLARPALYAPSMDAHHPTGDAQVLTDLASSDLDPRIRALVASLLAVGTINLRMIKSGHPLGPVTPGGRANDHWFYRAVDVDSVDGHAVADRPIPAAVVAVGRHILGLPAHLRPDHVMGPSEWHRALGGGVRTGFRDESAASARHADHLHLGFAPLD